MRHGTAQGAIDETVNSIGYWTGAVAGLAADIISERQAAARNQDAAAARRIDARTAEIQRDTNRIRAQRVSREIDELRDELANANAIIATLTSGLRSARAENENLKSSLQQLMAAVRKNTWQ
ncbi:chromosome segregation ATPase [Endobacter medicaginis]|uniref:Chromosome segregation ATPase n=1 Tax=Endobacter medicaginis TaxID=1181271 RepID=A0A839V4Y0_9PROT|nr:hypothetical protein [Endobacter medicaginis]MBB3175484.1 chromosome segregation ATPase [Endobacter medicaginis]MCX5476725.1 hypothetical protein [Endobacter medicaginis]NVN30034.1 hypothetical protein [Endobacter medicaginis]